MTAAVATADGVYDVDVETEELIGFEGGATLAPAPAPPVPLPRVVAAAAAGSTIVAVADRRPPLVVSRDAGRTWTETGGGLPPGRAVAIDAENPDAMLFAARNRLYLSRDGGRFWSALTLELPEILGVAFR